jgi:hypothetical protein
MASGPYLLANADRGLDESTRSRDLVDLAFLAARYGARALSPGLELAKEAFGSAVERQLKLVLAKLKADRGYAMRSATGLGLEDRLRLRKGLALIGALLEPSGRHKHHGPRRSGVGKRE